MKTISIMSYGCNIWIFKLIYSSFAGQFIDNKAQCQKLVQSYLASYDDDIYIYETRLLITSLLAWYPVSANTVDCFLSQFATICSRRKYRSRLQILSRVIQLRLSSGQQLFVYYVYILLRRAWKFIAKIMDLSLNSLKLLIL